MRINLLSLNDLLQLKEVQPIRDLCIEKKHTTTFMEVNNKKKFFLSWIKYLSRNHKPETLCVIGVIEKNNLTIYIVTDKDPKKVFPLTIDEFELIKNDLNSKLNKKLRNKKAFRESYLFLVALIVKKITLKLFNDINSDGSRIDELNDKIIQGMLNNEEIEFLFRIKRKNIYLLRVLLEDLEYINELIEILKEVRSNNELIKTLRVIREEILEAIEVSRMHKELVNELITTNSNKLNIKMNESIEKLTLFATVIGIPMLITGIYGMNFKFMPEIYWAYGYFFALFLMILTALLSYYYFKKKL